MRYIDTVTAGSTFEDWLLPRLAEADLAAIRTGFLTLSAVDTIEQHLLGLLDREGRVLVVAGGAPDQADPDALVRLSELLAPYGDRAVLRVVVGPEEFQNAKTYHLHFPDGHAEAWVGSANLTRGGLTGNHEAGVTLDSRDPAEAPIVDDVLAGIEAFRDRPGTTGVSEETRLLLTRRRTTRHRPDVQRVEMAPSMVLEDWLQDAMDRVDAVASRDGLPVGVPTPFADLNVLTGGLAPGTLTVIGGRPGSGRSTLLLDFVRHATIRHSLRSALFCLDQPGIDVVQRILCAEASIRPHDMRTGRMSDEDWTGLARRMSEVHEAPLILNATPSADLDGLCEEAVALARDEALHLVAIDPLNMVRARTEPGAGREREVSIVTRQLKTLALDLDIPIVVTCEVGRAVEGRLDHRPQLGDLRESDTMAQVADTVVLLHRPDQYERDDPRAGEADLIVAKHRGGPTATVTLAHQLHYARFSDLPG
ncbi:DnaB-like helicase C-terminal domain-containing protein [Saccharothrix sp. Mg75]|uniref:DnaB-like helicase C-terminal domain-containing protein n=1 Tax=Saccharothrix sp. Mg75 TaxID=3445357 RepID=UPI003EEFA294